MKIYRAICVVSMVSAFLVEAIAQDNSKLTVRAGADIGLTNGVSISSPFIFNQNKSSVNNYNIDFGYKIWQKQKLSLSISAGVGYENITTSLSTEELSYSYLSPAYTDEDGNDYIRHYELSHINQKINTSYFSIPLYLSFNYQISKRFALHADAGVKMGFKLSTNIKDCGVSSYSYGVYPEYGDLMIDADWLNNFGNSVIGKNKVENPETAGFTTSLFFGIGAEIGIAGPVSFDIGIRYTTGLNNIYAEKYHLSSPLNLEDAPVSYTSQDGDLVRPLVNYATRSTLSQLSLRAGVNIHF